MRASLVLPVLLVVGGPVRGAVPPTGHHGPSEADIRTAYVSRLDEINQASKRYMSKGSAAKVAIELIQLDFIECDPVDRHPEHYRCSAIVQRTVGGDKDESGRIEMVLYQENGVWKVF